ncbi:MAG TPA: glycosyltransferase [Gammaproteobacteria bacterium]|nr:glycosyltransferase [Gammaproteobacteria bacterium]
METDTSIVTSSPIKVVHAVLSLDCGGLERLVLHLCKEGVRAGDRVSVLCLDRAGDLAEEVLQTGAEVVSLERRPGLMSLSEAMRLRKILGSLNPDIIHSHQMGAALYVGTTTLTMRRPPMIHTEHGNHDYHSLRQRLLGYVAFCTMDRIYCVSQDIADNLTGHHLVSKARLTVQANGIPLPTDRELRTNRLTREQLGIDQQATIFGTVGRLAGIKRQERLLDAAATLAGKGRNLHLILVGEGEQRGMLENRAAELGIEHLVHFAGFQRDPASYISLLDIFILTSDSEGMPMALLEAWAAGKPVIVTAVGGLPELVKEGETGLLVPPGDHERLVGAMESLAGDAEYRRRLGNAGRSLVAKRYSAERIAATYRDAYVSLLQRRNAAPVSNGH